MINHWPCAVDLLLQAGLRKFASNAHMLPVDCASTAYDHSSSQLTGGWPADWSSVPLGPSDWPLGCLGYVCNLVRPMVQGHRAAVLYPLLGSTLVFDTLPHAAQYREIATQVRCESL